MDYKITDSIFELIRHLDFKTRLALIARISNSILTEEKESKESSFFASFGAWQGEQSADDLIENIRSARHFEDRVIEL